jgi:hypothetical protein
MEIDRSLIREGMTVYSSDGEKLGKVRSCDATTFVIEKGFFFRKDYIARYDDVRSVDDEGTHLAISKDAFQDLREGLKHEEGWQAGSFTTKGKPGASTADIIGADYGLGAGGVGQPGMTGDLSRSARAEATGEEQHVPRRDEDQHRSAEPRRTEPPDDT